jgi:hypothetical protein
MLCYIWGAIMLGLAIVVLVPMFSRRGFAIAAALFPFILLIIAATYCVTGYLIGRRRRFGAWLGVTVATLTALLQLVMHLNIMRISLTPGWLAVDALLQRYSWGIRLSNKESSSDRLGRGFPCGSVSHVGRPIHWQSECAESSELAATFPKWWTRCKP